MTEQERLAAIDEAYEAREITRREMIELEAEEEFLAA